MMPHSLQVNEVKVKEAVVSKRYVSVNGSELITTASRLLILPRDLSQANKSIRKEKLVIVLYSCTPML